MHGKVNGYKKFILNTSVTAALSCGFYFYSPNTPQFQLKTISPTPCTALPLRRNKLSTRKIKPRAGTVLVPPANRRVEFNGSGAPSWMMAQPQSAHGCAVCGAPSDPLDETREPAKRAVCRGRRLLVTFGLSKVTRQAAQRRRNLFEGSPSRPAWRSHAIKALDDMQPNQGMTLAPLTLALSHKGRGDQSADHRGLSRAQRLKWCRGKRHKQKPQP